MTDKTHPCEHIYINMHAPMYTQAHKTMFNSQMNRQSPNLDLIHGNYFECYTQH